MSAEGGVGGASPLVVAKGVAHAFFAFEVGRSVDLEEARRQLGASTDDGIPARQGRRVPREFEFRPAPLRFFREAEPVRIGRFESARLVDFVVYDFGAISIAYRFPIDGPLPEIARLSEAIADKGELAEEARKRVADVIVALGGAVRQPLLRELSETYVVVQADDFATPVNRADLASTYAGQVAELLRGSGQPLSAEEIGDAISRRVSFGADDVTFIDWEGALVVDRSPEDVLTVLEFANVELVEMRFLDQRLDDALDQSYEVLARRRLSRFWLPGLADRELRALGELQVDNALLFEGVNNALKLVGDQFLARVYRAANERFHMAEWDATILRKLETLDSLYVKMSDLANALRIEALEWIIIALIVFELAWAIVAE